MPNPETFDGINTRGTETLIPCKDATARSGIEAINGKIPSAASSSNKLVDTSAMNTAIGNAIAAAYKPAGTKTVAELTSSLLVAANLGNVYNMTDAGTTTADFMEGAGKPIRIGDDIGICEPTSGTFKFNILSGFIDTSGFQNKTLDTAITVDGTQETTVEGALGAINTLAGANKTAIGNIKDGTTIDSFGDVETALSDKVDKVNGKGLSTNDFTDAYKAKVDGAFPRSEQAVLGAKNLCPNTGVTTEHNNVTFTVNDDDTILTSGTATGGRAKLVYTIYYHGPNNPILTGCPENGGDNYWIDLYDYNTSQHNNEYGSGAITTIQDGDKIDVNINIKEGFNATGLIFKPMLSIDGGEYVPPAMTNRKLSEEVTDQIFEPQHNPNYDSSLSFRIGDNDSHVIVHKIGKIVVINIHDLVVNEAVTLTAWVPLLINLPARAKQIGTGIDYFHGVLYKNRNEVIPVQIDARQIDGVSYGTTLQPSSNVSLNANDKLFGTIVYVCQ